MAKQRKASEDSARNGRSLDEDIRALAYQLYCENGYQDGRDMEHWLEAERQVLSQKRPYLRQVA